MVHRDVKPSNVLIEADRVVLTDFGIADVRGDLRLTASGKVLGTPEYMAPERARGEAAQAASDLWFLGATLYAAVEGHPPFDAEDPLEVLHTLNTREPPLPRLAEPLAPILLGLLPRSHPLARSPASRRHARRNRRDGALSLGHAPASSRLTAATVTLTHPATLRSDPRHDRHEEAAYDDRTPMPDLAAEPRWVPQSPSTPAWLHHHHPLLIHPPPPVQDPSRPQTTGAGRVTWTWMRGR